MILENAFITVAEIMQLLDMSDYGVRKNIKVLKDIGLIKRVGSNKTGHWEIKE